MTDSPIRLMHFDPRWRQEFQQTRSSVLQACEGWVTGVEHVGSTAISGLVARPIIDMIAGAPNDESIAQAADLIEGLNYRRASAQDWSTQDWSADAIVLDKPRYGTPTHRIFLMRRDSLAWQNALAIRDYLRTHMEQAIRFEEAKVARWRVSAGDPASYQSAKAAFFIHLIDQLDTQRTQQQK